MPIYPGSAMSILRPGGISKCRPTRVRATGTATAYAKTGAAALREARAGMWYASAAEYHVLLVNCRCPG